MDKEIEMNDEEFREELLTTMGLLNEPKDEQDIALYNLESIAQKRFALALPEMFSDEQLDAFGAVQKEGKSDEEVNKWIQGQVPEYNQIIRAIIQDVAKEVAEQ